MLPPIDILNKTLELSDVKDQWFLDEKYGVWCLEDLLYTMKATTPKFQRLSIYVPKAYMSAPGVICETSEINGYTAKTAPVIFENNSAGYMQMPHTYLGGPRDESEKYLKAGMVFVTCGNRGSESRDQNGILCGKSPWNLVDLKTGIRFLRHNKACIPGDLNRIISVGWSAGGAMSTLLAVTGNHRDYEEYLRENGAFMEESDQVFASQIYCPIVDLDHADMAYEWMFREDKKSEDSPAGPSEVMTPFKDALSSLLSKEYIQYFNGLGVKNPKTGEILSLNPDGRSGSAYDYLMEIINESATKYLLKLSRGELAEKFSPEQYLAGDYTYLTMAHAPADEEEPEDKMSHFAGPGVNIAPEAENSGELPPKFPPEPPSLGDMAARPPKGAPAVPGFNPPMTEVHGAPKGHWLSWDGENATVKDLDSYVLCHRRRMKPCTSFDTFNMESGENRLFGEMNDKKNFMYFDTYVVKAIEMLQDRFPEEAALYYPAFSEALNNERQEKAKYLYNPFNYIPQRENADTAEQIRIRVGAFDADTSFSVSMTLACLLAQNGYPVDYALVWDKPHCEADYEGEVVDWIRKITLK
ncbi:MAG: hypothetical protein LUG62_04690 [Clostridiales bacterium]|nr:hypothetical protein [Clostridiales bacterium]